MEDPRKWSSISDGILPHCYIIIGEGKIGHSKQYIMVLFVIF
jgi:hypothetical protein